MVSLQRRRRHHHAGDYADRLERSYERAQLAHPTLVAGVTLVVAAAVLLVLVLLW